jgi:rhombotail lipoprotein
MKKLIALAFLTAVLGGCISSGQHTRRRSDLMAYLYPNRNEAPAPHPEKARMQLPLRLGIAFVPAADAQFSPVLPSAEKKTLDIVRASFQGRDWVREIVTIPSSYLTPGGGFDNLDQVARMYNVDVIALASVDQIQHSSPGKLSFLYVSIIAAYVLPLEQNDTNTLIDVAVFHVPSRTFLLRAPGVSRLKGNSVAVEESRALRTKADRGLQLATEDLARNLSQEVESFKASIVAGERPQIEIVNERGQSIRTSGSFGLLEAALAIMMLGFAWRRS